MLENTETPTVDLTEDAGYRAASGHSFLPVLRVRSNFIFNEDRVRTSASLKRATLRLSAIRLNSRPLPLPYIPTSKELGEFEKSQSSGEKSVQQPADSNHANSVALRGRGRSQTLCTTGKVNLNISFDGNDGGFDAD